MNHSLEKRASAKIIENILFEDIHPSGNAVCRHKGLSIFVPFGIPGEKADIIIETYKPFAKGKIVIINEASVSRVIPFCPYFKLCGGCNWQHIHYGQQLKLKKHILKNAFEKHEILFPEIPDVIPSPAIKHYRPKMEYSFSSSRWFYEDEGEISDPKQRCALGFHLANKPDRVIDIETCEMQKPEISRIINGIRKIAFKQDLTFYAYRFKTGFLKSLATRISHNDEIMISVVFVYEDKEKQDLFLNEIKKRFNNITSLNYVILDEPSQTIITKNFHPFRNSHEYITEKANGLSFRTGPSTFYQPNPAQAEKIFSAITELCHLKGDENIFDLYCGAGTISLHLSLKAKHITGIEGSAEAIAYAKQNATINNITNVDFIHGDVLRTFNNDFLSSCGKPDIIVLDPPRAGTLIEIKKMILNTEPRKIVYLSCHPVSLANDLKMLCEKYSIAYIQPFDMLPQTHQLETLVVLEKK